jgi:hypothetical protein
MTRQPLIYNEVRAPADQAPGFSVEVPTAGLYRFRLVRGGHPVGIRIWHGPPRDPLTGEELDRGHRWQATANGEPIDLDRVWPRCGREPITQAEHDYLCVIQNWARENAPDSPAADPRKKIDLITSPLPF